MGSGVFFGTLVKVVFNDRNRMGSNQGGSVVGRLLQSKLASILMIRPEQEMEYMDGTQVIKGKRDMGIPLTSIACFEVLEWANSPEEESDLAGVQEVRNTEKKIGTQESDRISLLQGQQTNIGGAELPPASGPSVEGEGQ